MLGEQEKAFLEQRARARAFHAAFVADGLLPEGVARQLPHLRSI
jgi:hypothetical protein